MKKILVVLPDMNVGGVTSAALNFIEVLSKNGYDVTLFNMASTASNEAKKYVKYEFQGLRKYWNLSSLNKVSVQSLLLTLIIALLKKCLNMMGWWHAFIFYNYRLPEKYDAVVAFRQCEPCFYFALHCVDAKTKIGMIHGNIDFMGNINSWSKYFSRFNYIACVSKAVTKGFREAFPEDLNKFVTVYNMFNVDLIKQKASEPLNYSVDRNLINIVSVTRQENNHKQAQRIPEVCRLLKNNDLINIHWYVVGDGPDYSDNKNLAKILGVDHMITYCGALSNPFPLIRECDFLVLTSKTEAFPMVLKEAQILGKPVIAMRYDGVEESFEDGVTGLIAEQNLENLQEKIMLLVDGDSKYLNEMKIRVGEMKDFNDEALQQFESLLIN